MTFTLPEVAGDPNVTPNAEGDAEVTVVEEFPTRTALLDEVAGNPEPVTVIAVPAAPMTGEIDVMLGGCIPDRAVKLAGLKSVVPETVTEILPVVNPGGALTTKLFAVEVETEAGTPLNETELLAGVVEKPLP